MNSNNDLDIFEILESITDGFFAVDGDFNFTYFNKAAERALRKRREEVLGRNIWECFPGSKEGKYYAYYYYALHARQTVHFEELYRPLNMWNAITVYPKKDGLAVYFLDVTEQHNRIEKIEQQNQQLQSISWIHSHQVRAPLTNILGLINSFNKEQIDDPENLKILDYLGVAAKNLDAVVQNIIDHGKEV